VSNTKKNGAIAPTFIELSDKARQKKSDTDSLPAKAGKPPSLI